MRVITGTARGRKLKTPKNMDVRPTTDNVKESVFDSIQQEVEGRRALDLFAGTGQLGIEALSRGAREAVFVDSSRESLNIVKENLKLCGFEAQTLFTDALAYLTHCGKFDLIFIDPPYDSGLYDEVMQRITGFDILTDGGIIIVECRREMNLPAVSAPYLLLKEHIYGKIKIALYTKRGQE